MCSEVQPKALNDVRVDILQVFLWQNCRLKVAQFLSLLTNTLLYYRQLSETKPVQVEYSSGAQSDLCWRANELNHINSFSPILRQDRSAFSIWAGANTSLACHSVPISRSESEKWVSLSLTFCLIIAFWPWLWWIIRFSLMCLMSCFVWSGRPCRHFNIPLNFFSVFWLICPHCSIACNHISVPRNLYLRYDQFPFIVHCLLLYFNTILHVYASYNCGMKSKHEYNYQLW